MKFFAEDVWYMYYANHHHGDVSNWISLSLDEE